MRVGSGGRRCGNHIGRAAGSPMFCVGVDIDIDIDTGCGGGVGVGADAMWQPNWVRVRT